MSENIITITVQNRTQAQVLSSIVTASNALRRAAQQATHEMEKRATAITEGRGILFGVGDSNVREVFSQEARLQTLLETAGYVGLTDPDVRQAIAEDYVQIDYPKN